MLYEKENELFDRWEKSINNFAKDGAGKDFENQAIKLIFIGKETNGTHDGFDMRDYLENGMVFKTDQIDKKTNRKLHSKNQPMDYNLYRWAESLLDGTKDFKFYSMNEKSIEKRKGIFGRISFVNIKKESGGMRTNPKQLLEVAERDKEYLSKQLELYLNNDEVKVLILLGDYVYTSIIKAVNLLDLDSSDKKRKKLYKNHFIEKFSNKIYIVKFYHHKASVKKEITYRMLQKVNRFLKENENGYIY